MKIASPAKKSSRNHYAVRIGYVPLVDASPLLMASELGLFEKHGVAVVLKREPGWSSIRDKISFGELDAAHAPLGLAMALTLGANCLPTSTVAPLMMSLNGNAITLSSKISPETLGKAGGLKAHLETRKQDDRKPTFAAVHPWSSHTVMLHSWLAREGLQPGKDVDVLHLPPPVMARNLKADTIDGFCVGEPWNSQAIIDGSGWVAARSSSMTNGEFEKALIVPEDFTVRQPDICVRLLAALMEACDYCADRNNAEKIASILARPEHLDCSMQIIQNSLADTFNSGVKTMDASSTLPFYPASQVRPHPSAANWLITGLRLVGTLEDKQRVDVSHIFSDGLYERASKILAGPSLAVSA